MLERLVEQRDAVTLVLASVTSVKNLSATQWATAVDMVEALRPFLDVTESMSTARSPTLSMIIPVLDGLIDMLTNTTGGLDVLRRVFVDGIRERFGDYMHDTELLVATTVDARFKCIAFTDDVRSRAKDATVDMMDRNTTIPTPTAPASTSTAADAAAAATPPRAGGIWAKFDRSRAVANSPSDTPDVHRRDSLCRELDSYLQQPAIDRAACPLEWWSQNKLNFPNVARVARDLLCVPATSVPSERLFSKAGDVVTKKRNSLKPGKAEKIIFLMENL